VNGATKTVNGLIPHDYLGKYVTPKSHSNTKALDLILTQGCTWGADNDCYIGFDESKYIKMIERLPRVDTLKYITMPDVVGNHEKTIVLFEEWHKKLHKEKLPIAFVLQDGCTVKDVPFDKTKAIFIGGTTEYKLSETVRNIVEIAKKKNKWVHMGRVNSIKRITYARSIGVDSFDGTSFSMFANTYIPKTLELLKKIS
jgi:hypothetical protein